MAYDRVWQGNLGPVQAGAPVHVARVRELLPADLPAAPAHDGPARSAVRLNSNPKPTLTQPCATQRRWPACWQGGVQSRPPACGSGRQLFHQAETDTRNVASARVLEKLEFVREGTLREDSDLLK